MIVGTTMTSMMATEIDEEGRVAVADRTFRIEHGPVAAAKKHGEGQWRHAQKQPLRGNLRHHPPRPRRTAQSSARPVRPKSSPNCHACQHSTFRSLHNCVAAVPGAGGNFATFPHIWLLSQSRPLALRVAVVARIGHSHGRLETGDGPADQGEEPKRQEFLPAFPGFPPPRSSSGYSDSAPARIESLSSRSSDANNRGRSSPYRWKHRQSALGFSQPSGHQTRGKAGTLLHDGVADTLVSFVFHPVCGEDSVEVAARMDRREVNGSLATHRRVTKTCLSPRCFVIRTP